MRAGRAHHGLVAVFEVNQRKTPMSQRYAVSQVLSLAIGAAMCHDVAHRFKDALVGILRICETAYPTHTIAPFRFATCFATIVFIRVNFFAAHLRMLAENGCHSVYAQCLSRRGITADAPP